MRLLSKKYHTTLAEYFYGKPLYLDEHEKKKPNTRKLVELPWQQTECQRWQNLESTLTDFSFIDTKIKSGMLFQLLKDYEWSLSKINNPILDQMYRILNHSLNEICSNPDLLTQAVYNRIEWCQEPVIRTPDILQKIHLYLDQIQYWLRADAPLPEDMESILQTSQFVNSSPIQAFSPHDEILTVASPTGRVELYRLPYGVHVCSKTISSDHISAIAMTPNSLELAYKDYDGMIGVEWHDTKLTGRREETQFLFRADHSVVAVNFENNLVSWYPKNGNITVIVKNISYPLKTLKDCHPLNTIFFVAGQDVQQIGFSVLHKEEWQTNIIEHSGLEIIDADVDLNQKKIVLLLKNRTILIAEISPDMSAISPVKEIYYQRQDSRMEGLPIRVILSNNTIYLVTALGCVGCWNIQKDVFDYVFKCFEKTECLPISIVSMLKDQTRILLSFPSYAIMLAGDQFSKTIVKHSGRVTQCVLLKTLSIIVSVSEDENMIRWFSLDLKLLGSIPFSKPTCVTQVGGTNEIVVGNNSGISLESYP